MPFALQIAGFIRFYGHDCFRSEHYPTSDKVIPIKEFWILNRAMGHVSAAERLHHARAVSHGTAIGMGGNEEKLAQFYDSERRIMFGGE